MAAAWAACLQALVKERYGMLPQGVLSLAHACLTPSAQDRPNVTAMMMPAARRFFEKQAYLRPRGCDVLCEACRNDKRKRE